MKSTDVIQPKAMSQPIANEGVKFNIPEAATGSELASIAEGFPEITMKALKDGGLPPRGQDCNGMFYLSTDQKVFLQNGGIITFNQSVSDAIGGYPEGAILDFIDSEGAYRKVKSLIDDNTNNFIENESLIDGTNWKTIDFADLQLENKANVSLDNTIPVQSFKNMVISWLIPDYTKEILVATPFTVPSDGYFQTIKRDGMIGSFLLTYPNGETHTFRYMDTYYQDTTHVFYPVEKDCVISGDLSTTATWFYPYKGGSDD